MRGALPLFVGLVRLWLSLSAVSFIRSSFVRNSHLIYNNYIDNKRLVSRLHDAHFRRGRSHVNTHTRKISFIFVVLDFSQGQCFC